MTSAFQRLDLKEHHRSPTTRSDALAVPREHLQQAIDALAIASKE